MHEACLAHRDALHEGSSASTFQQDTLGLTLRGISGMDEGGEEGPQSGCERGEVWAQGSGPHLRV